MGPRHKRRISQERSVPKMKPFGRQIVNGLKEGLLDPIDQLGELRGQ
jgi:hypothetical protein